MKTYHVHYHTQCINKSVRFYTRVFNDFNTAEKYYLKVLKRETTTYARLLARTKIELEDKTTQITWTILEEQIGRKSQFE